MKSNDFIFADLSTYTPGQTIDFYEFVFEWKYFNEDDYYMAYKGDRGVAGLYETPEKFKQIQMPHFWMSYIQVDDVLTTVEKANELGGIIELVDENNPIGKIALIRDPQGAGFTIYEGDKLDITRTQNEHNTLIWNELHVSNVDTVIPFYQGIFNWNIRAVSSNQQGIYNDKNEHIADVMKISNALKGRYEYWVCTFAVENLQSTHEKIISRGGSLVMNEENRMLFADNSGQAFFYIQEMK